MNDSFTALVVYDSECSSKNEERERRASRRKSHFCVAKLTSTNKCMEESVSEGKFDVHLCMSAPLTKTVATDKVLLGASRRKIMVLETSSDLAKDQRSSARSK